MVMPGTSFFAMNSAMRWSMYWPRTSSAGLPRGSAWAKASTGAGDQAGGAVGQPLRRADIGDLLAERALHRIQHGLVRFRGFRRAVLVDQRNQAEIDVALAQRLQRLAVVVRRQDGPERIDRV